MKIDCLALGDFQTNCYVLRSSDTDTDCLIIDPGFNSEELVKFLQQESLTPKKILLTHGHCDHIAGIGLVRETFGNIPVSISENDATMLTSGRENLSMHMGSLIRFDPADETISHGDVIEMGQLKLQALATPGHTPGGMSFYDSQDKLVFCGDTLFAGSVGRVDFPGGDMNVLLQSIRQQLFTLPDDTKVYTGHGPTTTIGTEKQTNPYLT